MSPHVTVILKNMTPDQLILDKLKKKLKSFFVQTSPYAPLRILKHDNAFHLLLQKKDSSEIEDKTVMSADGFSFESVGNTISTKPSVPGFPKAVVVPGFEIDSNQIMYFGDRSISIAYSADGKKWLSAKKPLIAAAHPLEVGTVFVRKNGFLLVYFEKYIKNGITQYSTHLAFINKKNPESVVWKTDKPVWTQSDEWSNKKINPIGIVFHDEKIITYWNIEDEGIFGVILSGFHFDPLSLSKKKVTLHKHIANPILSPQEHHDWEAFTTLNPAAVCVNDKVHILYRAQGFDYISTVGYAVSSDGYTIDERSPLPIYQPRMDFETNTTGSANPNLMSGGGFGGCEDPRITHMGDRIYMTYVAFNGWTSIRLALTSILVEDFLHQRWNWTKPVLLSRPGVIDKSGCLLPEKIGGKFVFFHRIFPNILIDYVDNLSFTGENNYLKGEYSIKIRADKWDSRKIGAGAPPIRTKDGWLLIYYGVDDRDDSKYHIGAMLLDLKRPEKVLYRCDEPILGPSEVYENTGFKPGIAYPCGAVVKDNELLVYYGGADSVVCVATAHLDTFLSELKSKKPVHLHTISIKEVTY